VIGAVGKYGLWLLSFAICAGWLAFAVAKSYGPGEFVGSVAVAVLLAPALGLLRRPPRRPIP
jgi:hypothetical protein